MCGCNSVVETTVRSSALKWTTKIWKPHLYCTSGRCFQTLCISVLSPSLPRCLDASVPRSVCSVFVPHMLVRGVGCVRQQHSLDQHSSMATKLKSCENAFTAVGLELSTKVTAKSLLRAKPAMHQYQIRFRVHSCLLRLPTECCRII